MSSHKFDSLSGTFPVIDSRHSGALCSTLFIGTEKVKFTDGWIKRKEFAPRLTNSYSAVKFDTIGACNPNHWQRERDLSWEIVQKVVEL